MVLEMLRYGQYVSKVMGRRWADSQELILWEGRISQSRRSAQAERLTYVDVVVRLENKLAILGNICQYKPQLLHKTLTCILDTLLGQDAVAPVGDAADSLHTTGAIGRALVRNRILFLLREPVVVAPMEPLLEANAHRVPVLTQGVLSDCFIRRDFDVVRERKPVVARLLPVL